MSEHPPVTATHLVGSSGAETFSIRVPGATDYPRSELRDMFLQHDMPPTDPPWVGKSWAWQATFIIREPLEGHIWPPAGTELKVRAGDAVAPNPDEPRRPPVGHTRFWWHAHTHSREPCVNPVTVLVLASAPGDPWMSTPSSPTGPPSLRLCPIHPCPHGTYFHPISEADYLKAGGGGAPYSELVDRLDDMSADEELAIRRALLQRLIDQAELLRAVYANDIMMAPHRCFLSYWHDGRGRQIRMCDDTCPRWHPHEVSYA